MTRIRTLTLALLAGLPVLVAPGVVTRLAAEWPLARASAPFFLPGHALDLYVLAPAVVLSAIVLFLLPGVLFVRLWRDPGNVLALTVLGFGFSLLLLIALETVTKLITHGQLGRTLLLGEWLALTLLIAGLDAVRPLQAAALPADRARDGRRLLEMAATVWLGVAALAPKIHWENLNVDGIEALEFGRSLSQHVLPYWDVHSGSFGFYPNFVLFAWPAHFFISIFGPIEAAARIPIFLYLVVIFAALLLLIEHGREYRLQAREEGALLVALALFLVVQAFNTNYEPYYADLAETAATDTLWMACFLAAIWALWADRKLWFWLFGLMNYAASPGGFFLLVALAAAEFTLEGPERRRKVRIVGILLIACVAITALNQLVYDPFVLQGARDQFSSINLLRRLFPPRLTNWARFDTLIFATGILPALSFLRVKRRDGLAWSTAAVTAIYFGVVYVQIWAAVHQFTPVMLLPHVVFWRCYLDAPERRQRILVPLAAGLSALCLFLSLPRHDRINLAVREVGLATDFRFANYDTDYVRAASAQRAVYWLFPEDYRLEYPEQPWGTDGYAWLYYATRPKPADASIAYIIQSVDADAPAGALLAGRDSLVAAYVVDRAAWQRHQFPDVPRVVMSRLYEPVLRATYRFFREYSAKVRQEETGSSGR